MKSNHQNWLFIAVIASSAIIALVLTIGDSHIERRIRGTVYIFLGDLWATIVWISSFRFNDDQNKFLDLSFGTRLASFFSLMN